MKKLILLFLPLVGFGQPVLTPTPYTVDWVNRSSSIESGRAKLGFNTNAFNRFTIIASNVLAANTTTFTGGSLSGQSSLKTSPLYGALYIRDTSIAIRGCYDLVSQTLLSNILVQCKLMQPNANGTDVGFDTFISLNNSTPYGGFKLSESDNMYEFIDLVYSYYLKTTNLWCFTNSQTVISNAWPFYTVTNHLAFKVPSSTNQTEWGFEDSALLEGYQLMTSLLRYRACRQMGTMLNALGRDGSYYTNELPFIRTNLQTYLWDTNKSLYHFCTSPATNAYNHSIAGSAYAVVLGACTSEVANQISYRLLDLYADKEFRHGMARHYIVPEQWGLAITNANPFSGGADFQTYQNGGYWPIFTPWVAKAMKRISSEAGDRMMQELAFRELIMGSLEYESSTTWAGGADTHGGPGTSYLASGCGPRSYWICPDR